VTGRVLRDEVAELAVVLCEAARRPVLSGDLLDEVRELFGVTGTAARLALDDVVCDGRLVRERIGHDWRVWPRLMAFPTVEV